MTAFISRSMTALLMLVCLTRPVLAANPYPATAEDVQCLADNISHEAPDESYQGKLAVATVTMNRVASKAFPKTVCDVVYQHGKRGCQFSWTCAKRQMKVSAAVYEKALDIANKVLYEGERLAKIKNALYFHNTSVFPRWSRDNDVRVVAQIGTHIFYVPIGA